MAQERALLNWQRRMAPFMTASIIAAAVFFAAVTLWEYSRFEAMLVQPAAAVEDVWRMPSPGATTYPEQFELARARAAFALEQDLIGRRYGQANLMLSARLWTRLMGFITGMILALVGAAFVLGKLSEDVTEAATKGGIAGQEWSLSLRSSSPGIILCVLGTVLMTLSIAIQGSVSEKDQAIYFGRVTESVPVPPPGQFVSPAAAPTGNPGPLLQPPNNPRP